VRFREVKLKILLHPCYNKKGVLVDTSYQLFNLQAVIYDFSLSSEDAVSFFLPLALLEANTLRPLAVAMRSRKPCLFFLFLFEG